MSDRNLLALVLVVSLGACVALAVCGAHVSPGPCEVALVAAGGLAALARRDPPDPPQLRPRG